MQHCLWLFFRTIGFYIVFLLHSYCLANNNGHYILNWFRFVRILDNKLKITAIQAQNYFSYSKPYNFPISSFKRNKLPRKQGFCIPNFETVYYNNISKIEGDNYFIHLVDVNWFKSAPGLVNMDAKTWLHSRSDNIQQS